MTDSDEQPVPASYSRLLDHMARTEGRPDSAGRTTARPSTPSPQPPEMRRDELSGAPAGTGKTGRDLAQLLVPPRRRDATESVRVKLAPEQFYWLHLAAARAGAKVDQSTIVAAALRLVELHNLDWRQIDSRMTLASALAGAAAIPGPVAAEDSGQSPARDFAAGDREDGEHSHDPITGAT